MHLGCPVKPLALGNKPQRSKSLRVPDTRFPVQQYPRVYQVRRALFLVVNMNTPAHYAQEKLLRLLLYLTSCMVLDLCRCAVCTDMISAVLVLARSISYQQTIKELMYSVLCTVPICIYHQVPVHLCYKSIAPASGYLVRTYYVVYECCLCCALCSRFSFNVPQTGGKSTVRVHLCLAVSNQDNF